MQETFSDKIVALRKGKKWTQEMLAEKCGISRQAVAKWENGQSVPDIFRIIELAELFQVELNELMANTHSDASFRYCTESFGNLYQMIFVFNLAQNTYRLLNYNDANWFKNLSDEGSIDDFIKAISKSIHNFEQKQKFQNLFCRKNLIHLWQEGEKKVSLRNLHSFENGEGSGSGTSSWIECTVCFVNKNSEPVGVFLIRTVDDIVKKEKKKQEEILGRQYIIDMLTKEYDSAHLVNLTEDNIYLLRFNNSRMHEYIKSDTDSICYSANYATFIRQYVAKNEQKETEEKLSPDNLRKTLSERKSFTLHLTIILDGKEHLYEVRCIRINDTPDFCFAMGFINRDLEATISKKREMYEEIIKTLAIDYDAVYLANLDSGKVLYSYTATDAMPEDSPIDAMPPFNDCFSDELTPLHKLVVHPEDYEVFKRGVSREIVTKELTEHRMFFITYRMLYNEMYEYYQTRIFRSINFEENHNFVVGVKNINSQIKMARHNMIEHEIDSLSGILNEKKFKQHVMELLPRCNFMEFSYALLLVEIDNFKQIVKNFGFSIGDYVLLETAKHLCIIFSNDDIIARIGENKFAIFIRMRKNSTINSDSMIYAKAGSLDKTIRKKYVIENNNVELSCKIGLAIVNSENMDYATLFESAVENKEGAK